MCGPQLSSVNVLMQNIRSRRISSKRSKVDKPCPRFTTTGASFYFILKRFLNCSFTAFCDYLTYLGACNRGLTCIYQHDPSKIAICWNFLQGNCPNTVETCALSHDPTPERTPLCVHFANNGRCTRTDCPFPHVRVGKRDGVCRDFAVLGYCEKGLDCDKQHVRECPDFAEKGECTIKGCKLPHVIRANRNRKPAPSAPSTSSTIGQSSTSTSAEPSADVRTNHAISSQLVAAEDAQLGDEFISLTFNESDSEDDEDEEDEDASEDELEEDEETADLSHDEGVSGVSN